MGYRNSYWLAKRARRGVAPRGNGYPNVNANARNPGREPQHGWPAGPQVPPPLPVLSPIAQQVAPVAKRNWFTNGAWYPLVVLLTLGLGCCVPFTHAGRRLQRPGVRAMGVVYTLVSYFALMLTAQNNGVASGIGLGVLFGGMMVETSHLVVLSRQIGAKAAAAAALVPAPAPMMQRSRQQQEVDAAVAKALTARAKRAEARALLATDPMLARDLHIGRPDLHGDYDDGGLVDINAAPATAIAATCDMKLSDAEAIVAMREERGQFANVDEMLVLVELPVSDWDWIRDRAVTTSV
jgi:DNA uptake protein ComE-like DNA-binding protein